MSEEKTPFMVAKIAGEEYVETVFKVITRDEKNRPEECVMIPFDRICEITGGEEFFTTWVHISQYNFKQGS